MNKSNSTLKATGKQILRVSVTLKLLSLNSPLASLKLRAQLCSCLHCLSKQVSGVYFLCMDMINIRFVYVNNIACVHKHLLNGK